MSMSEIHQGEPEDKEDKIEEVIDLNHHGHNLTGNLQLPVANDSNDKINNKGEHLHETSGNANDSKSSAVRHGHEKKQAALITAVLSRNVEQVKLLLLDCQFTDVDTIFNNGTALMQLVKSECEVKTCSTALEIMKLLLHNGARTCSDQSNELSVLCVATRAGRTDMVRLLCEHGVELNEICNNQTALMIAAELCNLELVEILLDHGASVNIQNNMKLDALHIALKFDHVECAKLLLGRGAHKNLSMTAKIAVENKQSAAFQFIGSLYKDKDNLLLFAIKNGRDDIVRQLIDIGADVNKVNSVGKKPLEIALESKKGESLIRYLIKNGACVNGSGNYVPLHLSMLYSAEITKVLLDSGADVNAKMNIFEDTALMAAIGMELDMEIVKLLISKGAQTNLQNKNGWTALHKATLHANVDLVELLVESGADLEIQTHDNKTAYLLAADIGNINLIETLENLGANTYAVDSSGYNALMLSIRAATDARNNSECSTLLYLARNGAQINHQCNNGDTALMMAAEADDEELMKTLLDLGADVNITASVSPNGKEKTAMSILFNNFINFRPKGCIARPYLMEKFLYRYGSKVNDLDCVRVLIRRGAINSLPYWCNDMLHTMIVMDRRRMIQLLLTNGMAPTMASFKLMYALIFHVLPKVRFKELSPLSIALVYGNIQVAQYLVRNWALCPCDLNFLSLKKLRDFLVARRSSKSVVEFLDNLLYQPYSLLQLSFTTVSHALGGVPGRVERINSLPLPQLFKETLMFRKEVVQRNLILYDYSD